MHQYPRFLILLPSLLFLPLIFSDVGKDAHVGWTPIQNIDDSHVTEIAKFAVAEYNKRSESDLKLVKVIRGETQVVAGTNYWLILKATEGEAEKVCQAIVWEKAWENFRNLTSFNIAMA